MSICTNPDNKRFLTDDINEGPGPLCLEQLPIVLVNDEVAQQKSKMNWTDTSCKNLAWKTVGRVRSSPDSDSWENPMHFQAGQLTDSRPGTPPR